MGLTNGVHKANRGLDNFLLAISPLALKIGLILGTISLLLGGVLAQNGYFQWAWAVIQAVGVDSVFLITARLFLTVKWRSWDKLTFGLLTLLYGSVALLALNIVSYQELKSSTLSAAMAALNIDLGVFTTLRSIVIVGTIALFYLIEDKANMIYGLGRESNLNRVVRIINADEQTKQIERPGNNEYQIAHRVQEGIDAGIAGIPLVPERIAAGIAGIYEGTDGIASGIADEQGVPIRELQVYQDALQRIAGIPDEQEGIAGGIPQRIGGIASGIDGIASGIPSEQNGIAGIASGIYAGDELYQKVYQAYSTLSSAGERVTAERIREVSGVGLVNSKKYLAIIRAA